MSTDLDGRNKEMKKKIQNTYILILLTHAVGGMKLYLCDYRKLI